MIKVLGIESSCDDSAASVVTCQKNILSNVVLSQHKDHMPFKGVVPEIAARKHLDNLKFCIKSALELSGCRLADIDAIGVTAGPGLIGGLIVGVMHAKGLAHVAAKPVIQINHLEGHILTARLTNNVQYPYLVLLVSGGHTQFVSVKNIAQYKVIGQTLDDAVGECFDKTAKILGLQYPGGPAVEKMAQNGDPAKYALPLSMVGRAGADLSFSGLKTATRMLVEKLKQQQGLESFVPDVCASFQYTIAKILAMRTLNAIAMLDYLPSSFVLAGGVAANLFIRSYLQQKLGLIGIELIAPPVNLCTDNGAMISWAAIERLQNNLLKDEKASLNPNLSLL
jgi:N6-L-threonylcarbamoyladenine synthase